MSTVKYIKSQTARPYKIDIYGLQDDYIGTLQSYSDAFLGKVVEPSLSLSSDGSSEFTCKIPRYYIDPKLGKIENPCWADAENGIIAENTRVVKLFVQFSNKEIVIIPLIINKISDSRDSHFQVYKEIYASSYACATLGKIGYKLELTKETLDLERKEDDTIIPTINYWLDKVFPNQKDEEGNIVSWNTDWCYEIRMNYTPESLAYGLSYQKVLTIAEESSADSSLLIIYPKGSIGKLTDLQTDGAINYYQNGELSLSLKEDKRESTKVYDDPYISSWETNSETGEVYPVKICGTLEKSRVINCKDSNKYNITQSIAEAFEVYCYYEYTIGQDGKFERQYTDQSNKIWTGKKVVFYNNAINFDNPLQINYQKNLQTIKRESDSEQLYTKMYVKSIASDIMSNGEITIADALSNPNMDEFILNFDYIESIGGITPYQKEEIKKYEANLRRINSLLISNNDKQLAINEELQQAKVNVSKFDKERASAAETYEKYEYQILNGVYGDTAKLTSAQGKSIIWVYDESTGAAIGSLKGIDGIDASTIKGFSSMDVDQDNEQDGYYKSENLVFSASTNLVKGSGNISYDITNTNKYYYSLDEYGYVTNIYTNNSNVSSVIQTYLSLTFTPKNKYAAIAAKYKQELERAQSAYEVYADEEERLQAQYDEICNYRQELLLEKEELNNNFTNLLGPALREGYYSPEDYDEAGQQYGVLVSSELDSTNYNEKFIWDAQLLDGEYKPYYSSDMIGRVYYPYIDISQVYNSIDQPNSMALRLYLDKSHESMNSILNNSLVPGTYALSWKNGLGTYYFQIDEELPINTKVNLDISNVLSPKLTFNYITTSYSYNSYLSKRGVLQNLNTYHPNLTDSQITKIAKLLQVGDYKNFINLTSSQINDDNKLIELIEEEYSKVFSGTSTLFDDTEIANWFYPEDEDGNIQYSYELPLFEKHVLGEYMVRRYQIGNVNFLNRPVLTGAQMKAAGYSDFNDDDKVTSYTSMYALGKGYEEAEIQYDQNIIVHYTPIYKQGSVWKIMTEQEVANYFQNVLAKSDDILKADKENKNIIYYIQSLEDTSKFDEAVSEGSDWDIRVHQLQAAYYLLSSQNFLVQDSLQTENSKEIIGFLSKPQDVELTPQLVLFQKVAEYNLYANAGFKYGFVQDDDVIKPIVILDEFQSNNSNADASTYNVQLFTINKLDHTEITAKASQFSYNSTTDIESPEYVVPRIQILRDNVITSSNLFKIYNTNKSNYQLERYLDYKVTLRDLCPLVTLNITSDNLIRNILNDTYSLSYYSSRANETLYLDALKVAKENSQPKYGYEIKIANLPDQTNNYQLGQLVFINDYSLGVYQATGYISKITFNFDQPKEDDITISNYKTKFEDLFGSISATNEAVKNNMPTYDAVSSNFSNGGLSLSVDSLQQAFNDYNYILNYSAANMSIDENGILLKNPNPDAGGNTGKILLTGGGIYISSQSSGGNDEWESAITSEGINANRISSGLIDTNKIRIMSDGNPAFQWNPDGIYAYKELEGNTYSTDSYVRYNGYGLQFMNNGTMEVSLGWNGLYIGAQEGSVQLTAKDGLVVYDKQNNKLISIGREDSSYGMKFFDKSGHETLIADGSGTLWLKQNLSVGENNDTIIIDGENHTIGSSQYTSGALGSGWRISGNGDAEFNNIKARGTLSAVVFEYKTINSVGGSLYVAPTINVDNDTALEIIYTGTSGGSST